MLTRGTGLWLEFDVAFDQNAENERDCNLGPKPPMIFEQKHNIIDPQKE